MAAVLSVASYSYCYSDTTYGVTNNAARDALAWAMGSVLPDSSPAYITVEVNGLHYQYTMVKDPAADATVTIANEDTANPGSNIFEHTDDWNQKHGGTIRKFFRFGYTDSSRWGEGSIKVEGEGTIVDPFVIYNYKQVVDEDMQKCMSQLADPSCPGYEAALAEYLANLNEAPMPEDPFYDEWVQASLTEESEKPKEEEVEIEEEEEKEESLEQQLGGENTLEALVDTSTQGAILIELAQTPKLNPYYAVDIKGGVYEETLTLPTTDYPDNRRALRNLASDANHRTMVRSQYERN